MGATNQPRSGRPSAGSAAIRPCSRASARKRSTRSCASRSMTGRHVGARRVGLADHEHLRRAGQALDERVGDRLVDEDARGGRALLARRRRTRSARSRDGVVEVGVGVDDDAVLAAHLGNDALELARAPGSAAVRMISSPTAPDPVNAIVATPGSRDERGAGLALAGQQRDRPGRDAGLPQRPDEHDAAAGRLLGGLEDDRVARRQGRGDHPHRDRDREVPRRDDRDDAARRVVHRVALAGNLEERLAALERDRPARVELEEVDRLADVGVGLAPGLGALADGERGELGAARAQPRAARDEALGAARRRASPTSAGKAAAAPRDRLGGLVGRRRRCGRDDAVGVARVGRDELVALAAVVADPHRHAKWPARASTARHPGGERVADRRAAQLEDRLVGERRAGRSWRGEELLDRAAAGLLGEERLVLVFSSRRRTR